MLEKKPKVITVLLQLLPYFLSFRTTLFDILQKNIVTSNSSPLLTVVVKLSQPQITAIATKHRYSIVQLQSCSNSDIKRHVLSTFSKTVLQFYILFSINFYVRVDFMAV